MEISFGKLYIWIWQLNNWSNKNRQHSFQANNKWRTNSWANFLLANVLCKTLNIVNNHYIDMWIKHSMPLGSSIYHISSVFVSIGLWISIHFCFVDILLDNWLYSSVIILVLMWLSNRNLWAKLMHGGSVTTLIDCHKSKLFFSLLQCVNFFHLPTNCGDHFKNSYFTMVFFNMRIIVVNLSMFFGKLVCHFSLTLYEKYFFVAYSSPKVFSLTCIPFTMVWEFN
jgi:hypothetical protein